MNMFWDTFCMFIKSEAKDIPEYKCIRLVKSKMGIEDCSNKLNSTMDSLHISKSSLWARISHRGLMTFICLITLFILSLLIAFVFKDWGVGTGILFVIILFVCLYTQNIKKLSVEFKMKLRLMLWKIPPYDDDMMNPRCIFVPWNKHQAGTWKEWLSAILLPKLQSELRISDMEELYDIIGKTEYSSNNFQMYSLLRGGVMGSLGDVPLWCFWLIGLYCFIAILITAFYEDTFKVISFLATFIGLMRIINSLIKSNKVNVEPDVEANEKIFDVICRLYRVMKKETIFFAVVSDDLNSFDGIPLEYQRYFKFLIFCTETINKPCTNRRDYTFNMNWLRYNKITHMIKDVVADIIFDCIMFEKCIPQEDQNERAVDNIENQWKFLRLLYKTNSKKNKVSNKTMLELISFEAALSYSEIYPESIKLLLYIPPLTSCSAIISNDHLQIKRMVEILKKKADTSDSDKSIRMFWFGDHDGFPNYRYHIFDII